MKWLSSLVNDLDLPAGNFYSAALSLAIQRSSYKLIKYLLKQYLTEVQQM